MITNKYYIVDLSDIHLEHILECTVGSIATARKSLDETKIVVKLPYDNDNIPECCSHLQYYTHEEILVEMQKPEWNG